MPRVRALLDLAPHLDLGRVYAAGQSFGGGTAAYTCTLDARFCGCFGLDPWMWTLPGCCPSLSALVGSEEEAERIGSLARAAQPSLYLQRERRRSARVAKGAEGATRRVGDAEVASVGRLRCPAVFLMASESWVAERSVHDVYGIDQRAMLSGLCSRGGAVAIQLWLEGGFHFDVTDIPSWAPRFGAMLGLVSPIHHRAGSYALQPAMVDAFLALHANAPAASAAMHKASTSAAHAAQLERVRDEHGRAAHAAVARAAPDLTFGLGDRRPEVQPRLLGIANEIAATTEGAAARAPRRPARSPSPAPRRRRP